MTNAAMFAAFARPALRLPTRLAVGFGLEALEACGLIHPGRWQAVAVWFPRSSAPRIRLASRRHGDGERECTRRTCHVKPGMDIRYMGPAGGTRRSRSRSERIDGAQGRHRIETVNTMNPVLYAVDSDEIPPELPPADPIAYLTRRRGNEFSRTRIAASPHACVLSERRRFRTRRPGSSRRIATGCRTRATSTWMTFRNSGTMLARKRSCSSLKVVTAVASPTSKVTNRFEPYAYAVVVRSCATENYSFGHELATSLMRGPSKQFGWTSAGNTSRLRAAGVPTLRNR
jgi:hypothetical protein